LEMARLQSGEIHLRKDWQSIEEVVGGAIRSLQPTLNGRLITVRLPDDLPLIEMDPVLMERVFANLLENASKYTPADTPIKVTATTKPGWITVYVSDRGPGLPIRDAATLFEKFTRGATESAKPGVGLGLSICRAIVEAHGGKIRASQGIGGGAVFSFDLPAPLVAVASDVSTSPLPSD
jgi:two-component system, OmpR family, sensor histidine kinase KdpD